MHNTNETDLILKKDVLALNKEELQTYGKNIAKNLIEEGWADPITLMVQSKKYLEILTVFNKAMKEATIIELGKHSGKATIGNAKIALGSTGDRLDYSNDPIWVELKEKLDSRTELLKMAYKQKENLFDNMGIEVPRVSIKTHGELVPKITL